MTNSGLYTALHQASTLKITKDFRNTLFTQKVFFQEFTAALIF